MSTPERPADTRTQADIAARWLADAREHTRAAADMDEGERHYMLGFLQGMEEFAAVVHPFQAKLAEMQMARETSDLGFDTLSLQIVALPAAMQELVRESMARREHDSKPPEA